MVSLLKTTVVMVLVGFAAVACNAPWEGPNAPTGSFSVSATLVGNGPFQNGQEIHAATSLSALRPLIKAC